MGSAFGTAVYGAVLAADARSGEHSTDVCVIGAFPLGDIVCILVMIALVAHAVG